MAKEALRSDREKRGRGRDWGPRFPLRPIPSDRMLSEGPPGPSVASPAVLSLGSALLRLSGTAMCLGTVGADFLVLPCVHVALGSVCKSLLILSLTAA